MHDIDRDQEYEFQWLKEKVAPAHRHKQLTKEYPEKKVITLLQAIKEGKIDKLDDRLVGKIQKHIQRGLNKQDKQKLTKMVQSLSIEAKTSLMAFKMTRIRRSVT